MKTALSRAIRLHSEGMNAEIKATTRCFDERTDFSARIVYLPFIRNHGFARNDTKGAAFRAFPAFSKAFLEMPKKKTVNLRLKNAVLCFGVVSVNKLAVSVKAFSLTTAREILGDEKIKTDGFIKYIGLPLHHKTFYSIRHGTLPYETNHFRFRCLHHPKQ